MKKINWFYLLVFVAGGLLMVAAIYLLLRASGLLYKLDRSDDKWVEYEN